MSKRARLQLRCYAAFVLLSVCGGCSMREMKGSPFYTGDYDVKVPDAEERRVNVWPLLYYREPVFSLLWPVFEHTEDHLSLRPVFSAYGDTKAYTEYSFLWPLCRADLEERDYRITPYFWGTRKGREGIDQDYHVLFPLGWHFEDSLNTLLPLWFFSHDGWRNGRTTRHDRWLCGPLIRFYNAPDREAWHVGPFYDYRDIGDSTRYCGFPAPLALSWRDRKRQGLFTPLYAYEEPVGKPSDGGWSAFPPLLSWHSWDAGDDDRWFLGPLAHSTAGKTTEGWHAALFGRYRHVKEDAEYAGFPWPLMFSWQTRQGNGLFTPLFGYQENPSDRSGYALLPLLLAWHTWRADAHSYWVAGALGHYEKSPDLYAWHAALFGRYRSVREGSEYAGYPWPFLFSWRTRQVHGFFSPLYAHQEDNADDGSAGSTVFPPLLYWHSWAKGDSDTWIAGPLARYRTGETCEAWHAALIGRYRYLKEGRDYAGFPWPVAFSWSRAYGRGLFTPLYLRNESLSPGKEPAGWAAAPPLLALRTWSGDDSDTWVLGPLGRYRSGAKTVGWHAGPFGRYHDLKADRVSAGFPWPLAFSWREKGEKGIFTPLYAGRETTVGNVSDGWAAAPLLLSWQEWKTGVKNTCIFAGLFASHEEPGNRRGHLLPLYGFSERDDSFLTPLFGWDKPDAKDPDGYWYALTPLFGFRRGTRAGSWLFPVYGFGRNRADDCYSAQGLLLGYAEHSHRATKAETSSEDSCGFFPVFSHSRIVFTNRSDTAGAVTEGVYRKDNQLLISYARSRQTVTSKAVKTRAGLSVVSAGDVCRTECSRGIVPFWFSTSESDRRLDGTLLRSRDDVWLIGWLYRSKSAFTAAGERSKASDYALRHVLWRFWRYERRDGNVCVDLFPAVTHDTRTDGFRKTSFLWRFYRYEKHPEGGVDMDLLFLPLSRAKNP